MKQADGYLVRVSESDAGTFGHLFLPGFACRTVELPWRDNRNRVSRCRPGTYECDFWSSATFPRAYRLHQVPGREAVLIHDGNWAGDKAKGLKSNSEGCILVGKEVMDIGGQLGVNRSDDTLDALIAHLGKQKFRLTIVDVLH